MASDPASLPSPAPVAPTHPCVRCGKPTAIDRGLCEECNPLGLRDASSSQVHGTVFLGVLLAVVVLAVLGRLALSGVGPFSAEIATVSAAADGLTVTLEVTNTGTSAGQTTCRVTDASPRSRGAAAIVQSPRIEPGETRSFTRELTEFGSEARELAVECHAP
jgi:hypothetical protein